MNIDTQFQHGLPIATPARSVHEQPDQASARPVERPHHDEAADNHTRQRGSRSEIQQEPHHAPRQGQGHGRRHSEPCADPHQRAVESAGLGELLDVIV